MAINASAGETIDTVKTYSLTDLSLIEEIEAGGLQYASNWVNSTVASANGTYSVAEYSVSAQYRTVAYPQDWKHLEGQEVQTLQDGIYV